jgi:hypothetical protein
MCVRSRLPDNLETGAAIDREETIPITLGIVTFAIALRSAILNLKAVDRPGSIPITVNRISSFVRVGTPEL